MKIRIKEETKIMINKFINETLFCYIMSCFQGFYPNKLPLALKHLRYTFDTYAIPMTIKDFIG